MAKSITQNELDVIQLLMEHGECSISQLERYLDVTATAVRQRLGTLMASGLIDRRKETEGRGRPTHLYSLTPAGRRVTGNNLPELASALWHEIQAIDDADVRQNILAGVANRLAQDYDELIVGNDSQQRLQSLAKLMDDRAIPVAVESNGGQATLKILSCPFPELAEHNRDVCKMEHELISKVIGGSLERCQCRQDGDNCCSYQASSE